MSHPGLCSISSTLLMLVWKCGGKGKCYPRGLPTSHIVLFPQSFIRICTWCHLMAQVCMLDFAFCCYRTEPV